MKKWKIKESGRMSRRRLPRVEIVSSGIAKSDIHQPIHVDSLKGLEAALPRHLIFICYSMPVWFVLDLVALIT
jgi:hypothetical protein